MEADLRDKFSPDVNLRYRELVYKAVLENCQESPGTSRQRIERYIQQTESREHRFTDPEHVRLALRDALRCGVVVRIKGFGLNGSFAPANWNCVGNNGLTGADQLGSSTRCFIRAANTREATHPYCRPPQTLPGTCQKTILKTPKRRFRVKRVAGVFSDSARRVKFAQSPTVVLISPKHKDRARSMRCATAR